MKSPAERGPIGAWAYEARADADLSVESVVERLTRAGQPVTAATIRGIEGGSKKPSRRLLRALGVVYGRALPGEPETSGNGSTLAPEVSAYLTRVDELVGLVESLVEQNAALMRTLGLDQPPPDVRAFLEAAPERPRTESTPRPAVLRGRTDPPSLVRSAG